jgi:hypothetical protein
MDWLLKGDYGTAPTNVPALILGILISFLGGQMVAWVYMLTHTGLSYSRAFVNSLVVLPVIVALVMSVLSNSLVTAFGMMAVFAIVRFRNILRDTLDTAFVLTVIVLGMAAGTQKFSTAIVGCLLICGIFVYLWFSGFGTRHRYDVIVNLHWSRSLSEMPDLMRLLKRHSRKAYCASQRSSEGYPGADVSYRLLLRDKNRLEDLLAEIRQLAGVSRLTSLQAEDESEL